ATGGSGRGPGALPAPPRRGAGGGRDDRGGRHARRPVGPRQAHAALDDAPGRRVAVPGRARPEALAPPAPAVDLRAAGAEPPPPAPRAAAYASTVRSPSDSACGLPAG